MPNKKVDTLKNLTERKAAQEWQSALGLSGMTTNEWNQASYLKSLGMSDSDISRTILQNRK